MVDSEGPDSPVGAEAGGLTKPPCLVRVDRYGSVSGLVEVEVALGLLVIVTPKELPYGCSERGDAGERLGSEGQGE